MRGGRLAGMNQTSPDVLERFRTDHAHCPLCGQTVGWRREAKKILLAVLCILLAIWLYNSFADDVWPWLKQRYGF